MKIELKGINNPRKENGDFGDYRCSRGCPPTGAYVKLAMWKKNIILCKGCLLEGIDLINKTILDDAVTKGKGTKFGR
jgi:hypothetical protein